MDIQYSDATKDDIDQILYMLKNERGDTSEVDVTRFMVAKDKEKIIGCVRTKDLSNECIELASLVVNFDYRNSGIGGELVRRILNLDKRRPIYLLCMKSREIFYQKSGFELVRVGKTPQVLLNEYNRIAEKLGDLSVNIIAMVKNI